ncbi:MAG: ferrous iron transporter B [Ruminococcaceae bacterium]|nr:ferrous iron transporter B [Oscillospiraceae bacterium]
MEHSTVVLMGNPNVGKTTLFNKLTGKHDHTGNWEGKTVEIAKGIYKAENKIFHIIDLPGIYSLNFKSPEEKIAKDFLLSGAYDTVIIVCDATNMHKSIHLALEIISICKNCILCINMADEAKRRSINIDVAGMEKFLNIPIIFCSARKSAKEVKNALLKDEKSKGIIKNIKKSEILGFITYTNKDLAKRDRALDKIFCGKFTALPVMLIFLAVLLWITISAANLPSVYIGKFLYFLGEKIRSLFDIINMPSVITGILIDGAYEVLSQVVSVMFVPMAVFFPLFSLLEESGFLPRIAYNLDKPFKKSGSNGKQALTMCMGLGCNAVGVTGCRIMPTKKAQNISILTNSFIPCNGRFPTLILLIGIILGGRRNSFLSSLLLTALIVLAVTVTFAVTFILNKTISGKKVSLKIELPSYKSPPVLKILFDSFFNKTLLILARAVAVSIPAGAVLWLTQNITFGGSTLINHLANFLDPLGSLLCMDGVILAAFILGSPANEIVLPIAIMIYTSCSTLGAFSAEDMQHILFIHGFDAFTAFSMCIFTLFHWPCATTLLTVKKETQSIKYTLLAILIPLSAGIILCILINLFKITLTGLI